MGGTTTTASHGTPLIMGGTPKQPNILGFANGINSNGDVVGGVGIPQYYGTLAVKWSGGGGQPSFLWQQPYDPSFAEDPSPGSEATCINDAGVIGGSDFGIGISTSSFYQAFVGTTLYSSGSTVNEVYAINNAGLAVGEQNNQATIFNPPANLGSGTASGINNADAVTGRPAQIVGTLGATGVLWERKQLPTASGQPNQYAATYTPTLLNQLVNPAQAQSYSNIVPYAINDSGAIVGTATYSGTNSSIAVGTTTYSSTATPPTSGSHGVLLLPLQLTVLNGLTPDFDGTVITTVIPAPENPQYANDIAFCGGSAVMGVLPMGQGRASFPNEAYTEQTLVAARAPAAISGIQYQWKRYISRRSWYIQMSTDGKSCTVTWRSSRGTASPEDLLTNGDDTGSSDSYNTTPSSVKHEFYFHDSSAIVYGGGAHDQDGTMKVNDFIHEEKAFIYVLQTSFDGTTWTDGISINTAQSETIKYQATGGTAVTDWVGVPNLQGGNTYVQGNIVPTITAAKVKAIVGSTVSVTIASDANTH